MDRRTRSTERLREDLNEKARRIQDLNGVLEANQRRITEMEEDNRRLKARVRAQQLLDLTVRVEDTEYIQVRDALLYAHLIGLLHCYCVPRPVVVRVSESH